VFAGVVDPDAEFAGAAVEVERADLESGDVGRIVEVRKLTKLQSRVGRSR
jgi:hypothetical protein